MIPLLSVSVLFIQVV